MKKYELGVWTAIGGPGCFYSAIPPGEKRTYLSIYWNGHLETEIQIPKSGLNSWFLKHLKEYGVKLEDVKNCLKTQGLWDEKWLTTSHEKLFKNSGWDFLSE